MDSWMRKIRIKNKKIIRFRDPIDRGEEKPFGFIYVNTSGEITDGSGIVIVTRYFIQDVPVVK